MRSQILLGILGLGAAVIAHATSPGDDNPKSLQGIWAMVAGEKAGQKAPEKDARAMTVEITADTLTFTRGDHRETFRISVDSTAVPHRITLTAQDGTARPGIYELAGNSLKLCLSGTDQRPADFNSTEGTRTALMVFERKSK